MSIKLIVTSTRPNRNGRALAEAIVGPLAEGTGSQVDIVDLREIDLPFLAEPAHPAMGNYQMPSTIAWSELVAGSEAIIFLTPEYNGSFTAAAKNALDTIFTEWENKVGGVIGYGWGGAKRAIPMLEQVMTNLKMQVVEDAVALAFGEHMGQDGVVSTDMVAGHVEELKAFGERVAHAVEQQKHVVAA